MPFVCQKTVALSMVRQPLPFNAGQEKKRGYFFKTAPHAIKRKIHRLKPLAEQ
jgi:hypothetical protein